MRTSGKNTLAELEARLPAPPEAVASSVLVKQVGHLVLTSGNTPYRDGTMLVTGKLGAEVDIPEGRRATEIALFNCLAALRQHLGSLDRTASIVNLTVCIPSSEEFDDQSLVVNEASDLLEAGLPGGRQAHPCGAGGLRAPPRCRGGADHGGRGLIHPLP